MKKYLSCLGASLVAIAALSSCNKELTDPNEGIKGGIPFEICASVAETRTTIDEAFKTTWVVEGTADQINLYHKEASAAEYVYDNAFSAQTVDGKFSGELTSALETGKEYQWLAKYPYDSYLTTPAKGYSYIGSRSDGTQSQTGLNSTAHLSGYYMPLVGKGASVGTATPTITMKHASSVLEINVSNSTKEALDVTSITFTAPESIIGQFVIDYTGETTTYTEQKYASAVASLSVTDGTIAPGASGKFYIAIKPFTVSSGVLKVAVNGYEKEIEISNKTVFAAGNIKKINFNYNKTPEVFSLVKTDNAFEDGGKYVLAFKNGTDDTYYFISNAGSSNNLSKGALTVTDGDIKNPDAAYVFTATADGSGFKLANSVSKYIYNSGSNTTLNTNNNTASTWYPSFISASKTYKLSQGPTTGRYISYGTSETDVKGYSNSNFKDQIANKAALVQYSGAISVFKLGYSVSLDPSILADNVTGVSARGLSTVMLTCSVENPVDGLSLSATCDGTVVTEAVVIDDAVVYTVAQNKGEARDGYITLTYGDVTKVVKVSQLAPVFTVSRTEVELDAAANSSSTITVTSDFDWMSDASEGAGFTYDPTVCEWTDASYASAKGKITVTITASAKNASEEGTKTLGTLTFTNMETSETLVVTVKQKSSAIVSGEALPFSFDSGKNDITSNMTQSGLGSDYKSAPKLKFDTANDYLTVKIASAASSISILLKQNGTGTTAEFTIYGSIDGTNYTSIQVFSVNPGNGNTMTATVTEPINSAYRYIKFEYTTKPSSTNIAAGSISIK